MQERQGSRPHLSSPASYFEATFTADAGRPYHVWVRMRADGNSTSNDSVHLQFDDSLTMASSPTARIGTISSLEVILQDGSSGSAPHGWGWADNGWGALGTDVYFATTGPHTVRVQQREDGAVIDQIVISPDTFLTAPPGWGLDDVTIFEAKPQPPSNLQPTVTLTAPANGATFTAPATVALAASASDPENRLARVDFRSGTTVLGSDTTAPFTFQWASVPAGTYTLTAVAHDSDGGSATSSSVSITVGAVAPPFPTGWQHQDIGGPAIAGSATYNNGTYTVRGAGENIWNTSDEFRFVYRQVTGDVDIVARFVSLQGSNEWSKAGVMVRESLTDNARHALAHFTLGNGYRFIRRTALGGTTGDTGCGAGTLPGWVRLIRSGNSLEMRRSTDGQTWSSCATLQISMAPAVYVGLVVSNVDATQPATAVFDNVTVLQGTANQPPTVSLTAPASGASFTAPATIALSATASDPENRLARVEFYNGTTLLNADTAAPYGFSWSNVAAGTYQLKAVAVDADGGSASSATATVTVATANQAPTVSLTLPANGATFTAPATVALAASASDPENRLARVDFRSGTTVLGSDTTAPFTFQWASVPAGTYTLTAVAHDSDGGSATSSSVSITVGAAAPPFPTGWQHQDVGAPTVAGTASFNNGTFTVTGAGTNIWDVRDQFHFVYQQVTGDVDIIARLASLQGSNQWSKAGVMVRESLADNARHGLAHFTLSNGSRYIWRTAVGGTTGDNACAAGTAPGWVRLTRTGSSLQTRYSADGQTWSSCATVTIAMAPAVYVGLVVSNVDATQRATAVFDNVSVTPQGGTSNQPPTVSLTGARIGSTFTAPATITLTATAIRSGESSGAGRVLQRLDAPRHRHLGTVQLHVEQCGGRQLSAEGGRGRCRRRLGVLSDCDRDRRHGDAATKRGGVHCVGRSRDRDELSPRSVPVDGQSGDGDGDDVERSRQADAERHQRDHRGSHDVPEQSRAGELPGYGRLSRRGRQITQRRD